MLYSDGTCQTRWREALFFNKGDDGGDVAQKYPLTGNVFL